MRNSEAMPAVDVAGGAKKLYAPVLGVFLLLAFGGAFAYYVITNHSESPVAIDALSKFVGKTYQTADRQQTLSFKDTTSGELIHHREGKQAEQYDAKFLTYTDNPIDEIRVMAGIYNDYVWLQDTGTAMKTEQGGTMFGPDNPDSHTIIEMWELADAAESYYEKWDHYPRDGMRDPDRLKAFNKKLDFSNPATKQDQLPEIVMVDWPQSEALSQHQTDLEQRWLNGEALNAGMPTPGTIRCVQLGWPKLLSGTNPVKSSQSVDQFFIEGFDRFGELMRGYDGKVFLITLKNGADHTPPTAPDLVPKSHQGDKVKVVIANTERPTIGSILFKYFIWFTIVIGLFTIWTKWPAIDEWARNKKSPNGTSSGQSTGPGQPPGV